MPVLAGDTVTVRHQPQRPGRRQQTLAHRHGSYGDRDILPRDVSSRTLSVPNDERILFIRHALRTGFTSEEIFNLTKIDRWFLAKSGLAVWATGRFSGACSYP